MSANHQRSNNNVIKSKKTSSLNRSFQKYVTFSPFSSRKEGWVEGQITDDEYDDFGRTN